MRINIDDRSNIDVVTDYNTGVKPHFAPKGSTMSGIAYCPDNSNCGICVSHLVVFNDGKVAGWFETHCPRCGRELNWSDAASHI